MATFEQRESGLWQAKIRRKGQPQQSKTFFSKDDAVKWARQVEAAIDRGSFVSADLATSTTFDEAAKRFSAEFAEHHYRGGTWKFSLGRLTEFFGQYSLTAITAPLVCEYRDKRIKACSGATAKKELDLLSKVLGVCQKEFGIYLPHGNPVSNIRKPKGNRPRDRRLSGNELTTLLKECESSQNKLLAPAVLFSMETALRRGELAQLEWKHIDWDRRLALLLDPDKIKNGEARAVPLSSRAIQILEALPRPLKGGRIFPAGRTLYQAFRHARERAGIKNFTWHDLRHEAISRLAERGDLTLLDMAGVSGHKTLQMLKRYTHLNAEALAKKLG